MVCLENAALKVWIKPKGAEVKSLVLKPTGVEFIWEANPFYWANSAPVLFPIVGALKQNQYTFDGKSYELPRHGFARHMVFETAEKSPDKAVFVLKANQETRKVYPFDFTLRIGYQLIEKELHVAYLVQNEGTQDMYFSIGGHPAFSIPFGGEGSYPDYSLTFNKDERLERWLLNDVGLLTGDVRELPLEQHKLNLSKELFFEDALVLKNLQSDQIILGGRDGEHKLRFTFQDFPYFGIWAAKNSPFVCLEPWCGIADSEAHNQDITQKEGIVKLTAGMEFSRSWAVEVI